MTRSDVAVVILNWNGRAFLEEFLHTVIKHTPAGVPIVVADNASEDDSLEWLTRHHPDIRVIEFDSNHGFAGGYNLALEKVAAEYYVLLNSDIEVTAGWLEPLLAYMNQHPEVVACQPKILSHTDPSCFEYAGASGGFLDVLGYPFCRGRVFDQIEKDEGQYNLPIDVFWATGACLMIRSVAFFDAGGFDSRFFAHMEEIDLCWRLQLKGHAIGVVPQSVVFHVGGGTLPRTSPQKTFLNFRNSLYMIAKNLPARYFYPLLPIRLGLDVLAALKFLLTGYRKDAMAVFRAHWAFFSIVIALRSECTARRLPAILYRGSIVADYYVLRRKRFSEIPSKFR